MKLVEQQFDDLVAGNGNEIDAYLYEIVQHRQVPDTRASFHVYMLRMDGNGRPRTNDLAEYISYKIVDYCIPKSQIREAQEQDLRTHTTANILQLRKIAASLFTDIPTSGEGGELLLFLLTQSILNIPQMLCKMPLKTNPKVHYHGSDGVYAKYDDSVNRLALYWGESKIYSDIAEAMSDCLDSIKPFLVEEGVGGTQKAQDMLLFKNGIDLDNPELQKAVLEFLNPQSKAYLNLEYRGVCLIGFDESSYPSVPNIKTESQVISIITSRIDDFEKKLKVRLNYRAPLDTFSLEIFLVPFSNVEQFRKRFGELVNGK